MQRHDNIKTEALKHLEHKVGQQSETKYGTTELICCVRLKVENVHNRIHDMTKISGYEGLYVLNVDLCTLIVPTSLTFSTGPSARPSARPKPNMTNMSKAFQGALSCVRRRWSPNRLIGSALGRARAPGADSLQPLEGSNQCHMCHNESTSNGTFT